MYTVDKETITVMFDPPFWIVLFEKIEDGKYSVAREVIGSSEPSNSELKIFFNRLYLNEICYSVPAENDDDNNQKKSFNFKRMQREIKKMTVENDTKYTFSKAQAELKKQQELNKQEKKSLSKEEREKERDRRFEQKQQKKKQKLRGR